MLFYFLRHADPIYHPDCLTPLGKRQAEALAKRLSVHGLDEIYSSTSTRAKETAQPTAEILKKDITELDWCNEGYAWRQMTVDNNGNIEWCFQNEKFRKILNSNKIKMLGDKWYDAEEFKDTTFKEGILRIQKETDAFFEQLGYKHDRENRVYIPKEHNDKKVALFAHQGFGMMFLSSVLDIPYPDVVLRFDLTHSSMTVIEFDEKSKAVIPKILTLSNDSHLYKESLPTKFNNIFYI